MAPKWQYRQAVSAHLTAIKARLDFTLCWLSEGNSVGQPRTSDERLQALSREYDECNRLRGLQLNMDLSDLTMLLQRVQRLLPLMAEVEQTVLAWLQDGLPTG